jgi:hypothetical protein
MSNLISRIVSTILMATWLALVGAPAAQARFLSPDTYDPWMEGVDFNRYAYSGNDPVNGSDPNGHVGIFKGDGWQNVYDNSPTTWVSAIALAPLAPAIGAFGIAGYTWAQTTGAGAIMFGTEVAAGEVGIVAPTVAGTTVIGGKILYNGKWFSETEHHIFPQGSTWSSLAKRLGIDAESPFNKMKTYQQYGKGHRDITKDIINQASKIDKSNLSLVEKQTAMRNIIQRFRDTIAKDPYALLRTKSDSFFHNQSHHHHHH